MAERNLIFDNGEFISKGVPGEGGTAPSLPKTTLKDYGWTLGETGGAVMRNHDSGNLFVGHKKSGETEIVIKRVENGIARYVRTAETDWANRETLTYEELSNVTL